MGLLYWMPGKRASRPTLAARIAGAVGGPVLLYATNSEGALALLSKAKVEAKTARGLARLAPQAISRKLAGWKRVRLVAGGEKVGLLAYQTKRRKALPEALLVEAQAEAARAFATPEIPDRPDPEALAALVEAGRALASKLDGRELMRALVDRVHALTGVRDVFVARYDAALNRIDYPLFVEDGKEVERPARPARNGLIEYVAATGEALLIPSDFEATVKRLGLDPPSRLAASWLGVPLNAGGKTLGVLGVADKRRTNAVSESHIPTLSALASQFAVSLQNAELYGRLVEYDERSRGVIEAATAAGLGLGILRGSKRALRLTYANAKFAEMLGVTEREATARSILDFIHPSDHSRIREIWEAWRRGDARGQVLETSLSRAGQEPMPIEVSLAPASFSGEVQAVIFVRDLTQRRIAEEALRNSERRYRDLFEGASDLIQIVAPGGKILYVNRAWRERLGYSEADVASLTAFDVIHPESQVHCRDVFRCALEGQATKSEAIFVAKSGRKIDVAGTCSAQFENGKPVALRGIFRDVTEAKLASELAAEADKRIISIYESMPTPFMALDRDWRFVYLNPVAVRMRADQDPSRVIGRTLWELYPELLGTKFDTEYRRAMREGVSVTFEETWRGRSFETHAHPTKDGLSVSFRDVTTARRAEQERNLLTQIPLVVSEADDLESALTSALVAVCQASGWDAGDAWVPSPERALTCRAAWSGDGPALQRFVEVSRSSSLRLNEGLPGRVLANRSPEWSVPFRGDSGSDRGRAAEAAGLASAVAVPVLADTEVVAVLVFYARAERAEDAAFMSLLASVAAQLGAIVKRRHAEEALRMGEERRRLIVEHSNNLFYSHGIDHVLTYVSPQSRQFFDCDPEEARVRWMQFATDHPVNALGLERTERAIRTGERQPVYELELVGAKGRKIWVEVNEAPVVRDGKTVAIVGALTDITEKKRREREIADLAKRYAAVVEIAGKAGEGLALIASNEKGEGVYTMVNDEFARIVGREPSELVGRGFLDTAVAPEEVARVTDIYTRRLRGEVVPTPYETVVVRKDGTRVPVEVSASTTEVAGVPTTVAFVRDISERKAAETRLTQLKNLMQDVVDNVPAGVLYMDAKGVIVFENRFLLRLMGATEEDSPRGWFKSIFELDTVTRFPEFVTKLRGLLAGEAFADFDLTYLSLYGREVAITVHGVPIVDDGGGLRGGILLVRDATEERALERQLKEYAKELERKVDERTGALREANAALEKANLNLETIYNATIDGFLFVDREKRFASANNRFCELFGFTLEEVLSGDPERVRARGRAAMKDPAYFDATAVLYEADKLHLVYDGEIELVHPVPRRVHEHSEPIFDAQGEYQGRVWTYRDVTEQRALQEALAERSQLLTTILENVTDGVFALSPRGEYLFCNRRHSELMGFAEESVVHRALFHGFGMDANADVRSALSPAIEGRLPVSTELPFVNRAGNALHLEWNLHPLVVDGRVVQIVGTVTDLTERRRLEEELIQYTRTLEEEVDKRTQDLLQAAKMAALGQLVAGVAHEINNPLAFVKSNTETLLEVWREIGTNSDIAAVLKGDLTRVAAAKTWLTESGNLRFVFDEQPKLLEMNMKGLVRIGDIVHRLKSIASPQPTKKAPTDLNATLSDTAAIFQAQFRDRVSLTESFDPSLPPVVCDGGQIGQVAMNLLTNAAQAIPGEGRVRLATRREGRFAVFEVEDDGVGMPPEVRARIFDPFFTTKDKGNTGLGLSITFQIVKEHDGTIAVKSTPGQGTLFTVRIPIDAKRESEEST